MQIADREGCSGVVGDWLWWCSGAALRETHIVVSSSKMSARPWTTVTWSRTETLLARGGSMIRLLLASQSSEAIETQRLMADTHGFSSNQWTTGGLEASYESAPIVAYSATHNTNDLFNAHNAQDVSFTDRINMAKSSRSIIRFNNSVTTGCQPTEPYTTKYIKKSMNVFNNGSGVLSK